jgi:hypothetical protein
VLIAAERALFRPGDGSSTGLTGELHKLVKEPDDWSRLLACSALLSLGKGGPDLCRQRNALVAKGIEQSDSFTFPPEMQVEILKKGLNEQLAELFDLVFHQSARGVWLEPSLFDLSHHASRFFLSAPREFFSLVADILDPKGQTELAKWKQA